MSIRSWGARPKSKAEFRRSLLTFSRLAAFPIATFWKSAPFETTATTFGDNSAGVLLANAPMISRRQGPVDPDTPRSAMTKRDYEGREMKLVFSDEFNEDGRYFYPGSLAISVWLSQQMSR